MIFENFIIFLKLIFLKSNFRFESILTGKYFLPELMKNFKDEGGLDFAELQFACIKSPGS